MKFFFKKIGWVAGAVCVLLFCAFIGYLGLPLPKDLFAIQNDLSVKITDRNGVLLRETLSAAGGRTTWLSFDQLPATVTRAVMAVEDRRFFSHPGVDVFALGRAVWQNLASGRVVSGASTITQQLVKQQVGFPRSLWGKGREMLFALRVERHLSKQEILTQYLNRVSFSNQAFGIEAASRLYFGKPAAHLSLAESVYLVGLIQAPSRFNPYRSPERALQRQRRLLEQLRASGAIQEDEYQLASREMLRIVSKNLHFKASHFCDALNLSSESSKTKNSPPGSGKGWVDDLNISRSTNTPPQPLAGGENAQIKTTLDYYVQQQVEAIVTRRIDELKDYHVTNAAVLVLDNDTGDILAYVGSKDYFDDAISGQVNGVLALRQPGSTLKPFTYQLALERNYTPATLLPDIKDFPNAPRTFIPENYDRKFHGPVRLREALACSYNLPAARVAENIGVEALYRRLHQYGFDSLKELPSFYGPGLTLGNGEVTLFELTRAYAILARGGKTLRVRTRLDEPIAPSMQAFAPRSSYIIAHILADRQAAVRAFGEDTPLGLPFVTAVKTGTSKDYRDNWTVGFTRDYTVGVWVGNFDGTPMRKVSGITGAAPIYRDVMLALYRHYNPSNWLASLPEGLVTRRICPLSGKLVQENCPHGIDEIFFQENAPTEPCDMHHAVWVNADDGLLTQPDAPNAVKKVFTQFPPLYQSWAHEMGYPEPPTRYSAHSQTGTPTIHIVHPNHGDVYALDPILRPEFQTIQLAAVAPPDVEQITWYVDEQEWASAASPFRAAWQIRPGTHRIYAEGERQGEIIRSEEITVFIVQ
ncbi:membrane carboxypeptidase [Candidatus Moduliflexus flocculans]|uniref:peptidoglycan glycosyltransferase n=1 Tax=Candidatus Moduliflexus flocculans TaxID=1499966 RepID=A0A0S6VWF6_9BACT|nr:membrane carboxypeptidase [Candidatus Moduliflexus flocculans]